MNRRVVAGAVCMAIAVAGGLTARAQETAAPAGDAAALEQQRAAVEAEIKALEQKRADRKKVIDALPAVADAKKAKDEADNAYRQYTGSNEKFTQLSKAASEAGAASAAAIEAAKLADAEYMALRKLTNELRARRSATNETARADIDKELAATEAKKTARLKVLSEQQPVADAKQAAAAAAAAHQAFMRDTAEYVALVKARDTAAAAYEKVVSEAKAADQEYAALRKETEDAAARRNGLSEKIKALKAAAPAK